MVRGNGLMLFQLLTSTMTGLEDIYLSASIKNTAKPEETFFM